MVCREKLRVSNILSLAVGLGICALLAMDILALYKTANVLRISMFSVTLVAMYVSFLFLCYLLNSIVYGLLRQPRDIDFIVVLGSGLIRSKVPPLLASRLDRARALFSASVLQGQQPMIITSGGQGPGEEVPESRAMADYLFAREVPESSVIMEDRSRTTEQNLRFSKAIMDERKPDHYCVVVTNNFHSFRAAIMTRKAKINGEVIGSRTAFYFWPSATIREFLAIFMRNRIVNFGICLALLALIPLAYLGQK